MKIIKIIIILAALIPSLFSINLFKDYVNNRINYHRQLEKFDQIKNILIKT